ncbi:Stonustoxin subunit alpha, partial [Collichthys lucidus]
MDNEDKANKAVSSTLDLLKEDFSQFTSVFSINSSKDKEMKSTEKTINPLSVLKEDFNHFKDVFRIGPSQQREPAKESSTNTFKIKVWRADRTDEPFKGLFRRDQKDSRTVKETLSETRDKLMDDGFRGNETVEADNMKEVDELDGSEESEEVIPTSQEAEDETMDEPGLPRQSLSSGICLLSLRDSNKDDMRDQQGGDVWLVKN